MKVSSTVVYKMRNRLVKTFVVLCTLRRGRKKIPACQAWAVKEMNGWLETGKNKHTIDVYGVTRGKREALAR